jgi:nucleotide-binding universal stress UspA family protein
VLGHVHVPCAFLRGSGSAERLESWAQREEEEQLRDLATSHRSTMSADEIRIVDAPSAREGVALLEARVEPDLICMSGRGQTGGNESLAGSVTEFAVRHAKVPVLVARGGPFPEREESLRVLVGLDLLTDPSLLARKVAGLLGPRDRMLLVHAVEPEQAQLALAYGDEFVPPPPDFEGLVEAARVRLARVRLGRDAPNVSFEVRRGCAGGVLCGIARAWDAHLVVTRTHGRRVCESMVLGSVSEFLLHKCPRPILVYPKTY